MRCTRLCVCVGSKGLSLYYHRGAILSRSEKLVQNTSWRLTETGAAFGFAFILETNVPEIHWKQFSSIQQCMNLHKCRKCLSFEDTKSTTVCLLDSANQFLCGSGLKYVVPQPYWLKHVLVNTFKIIVRICLCEASLHHCSWSSLLPVWNRMWLFLVLLTTA